MRLVKTGKSIMNLTEEEANDLIKMVYGPIGRSLILKVKDIGLNDEDDCNMLVTYSDGVTESKYIFDQDEITRISGSEYISSKIKIEFLLNHGYLKIENSL